MGRTGALSDHQQNCATVVCVSGCIKFPVSTQVCLLCLPSLNLFMSVLILIPFLFYITPYVTCSTDIPLSEWAFVTSHDAGTGYLQGSDILTLLAKTQTVGLSGQLDCGVRAFDLRPTILANGSVIMSHGPVLIPTLLSTAIQDVVMWAARNPSELILIYISHCLTAASGITRACLGSVYSDVFTAAGLTLLSNCTMVNGLTVKAAMDASTAPLDGVASKQI